MGCNKPFTCSNLRNCIYSLTIYLHEQILNSFSISGRGRTKQFAIITAAFHFKEIYFFRLRLDERCDMSISKPRIFHRKRRKERMKKKDKIGGDRGFSVPGAGKLDRWHPFKSLLFSTFFISSILGGQFLLPQIANNGKREFFQLQKWMRQKVSSAWGSQIGLFASL